MPKSDVTLSGKRCLVLDDEFLIALDIQQVLEDCGADVVCAGNVADALSAIDGAGFDLGVLDLKLSGTPATSIAVAEALSARGTPIVFLTGMRGDDVHTARFPRAPVVIKPYETPLLLSAIARALSGA